MGVVFLLPECDAKGRLLELEGSFVGLKLHLYCMSGKVKVQRGEASV